MDLMDELLGESAGIVAIRQQVTRLLQRHQNTRLPPILIQGETGTGKGHLARLIHRASPRRDGPFENVDCPAIPDQLFESVMFGAERGAFTDARQARPGRFQSAHRGTIFLDEVGLLPEALQRKLLKVIEERTVRRLGGTRDEPVDVWIIAATNEDLAAAVREHRFREDLYFRLIFMPLTLPPVRERGEDVIVLAQHLLDRACAEHHLPPMTLDPSARAAVLAHDWPGNVRDVRNVMERVALLAEAPTVNREMLDLPAPRAVRMPTPEPGTETRSLRETLGSHEREHLVQALNTTSWNLSRAAKQLGIKRNTLRYRIKKLGLERGAPPTVPLAGWRSSSATPESKAISVPPSVPRWEPRRLTLLRVVLVPVTPADVPLSTNRALELIAEKVQTFGGRIEERSPTGLVAAFGLDPIEDAPRRAALAAVAIHKAGERARSQGEARGLKLGVHVAEALVRAGAGGTEIDLNAKLHAWTMLESLLARTETNAIVVSETAHPYLERRFDLVPLEVVDGAAGRAYRLTERDGSGAGLGRRTAVFVGRWQNLEVLQSYLAAVIRGHGQIVGIMGEAGIGKSRLVAEFRQSLVGEPVTYREGVCLSYGSAIPYLPICDILRQTWGLAEADTAETVRDKVSRSLETAGIDPQEASPYLFQLLGLQEETAALDALTPEAIKRRTLEILRRIMITASRQRPVVLVVEDLHWIDKTSEEFLTLFAEDLPGAPIMFLSTYRSGYRPAWIEKSYATQMSLQPLSPEDSLAMIGSLCRREVSESLARLLLERAEGNPFFLEELCRAVEGHADTEALPAVPATIQEVLVARIERLPAKAKRLLQTASVLGREFSARLLAAIHGDPGPIDGELALLSRQEFLYQRSVADEPVYVFKHALTREVAYAGLSPADRRELHAAAGRALESTFAGRLDEACDSLAYHYAQTADALKAVEYLSRFAERAARGDAHGEAVQAWQQALQHVEGLPVEVRERRHLELVLRLPNSLLPLGRIAEVCSVLLQERERLDKLQDSALAARYYYILARAYMLGNHALVAENARRAIAAAERCGDYATRGAAYGVLSIASALSGQAAQGIESGQQAVQVLENTREQWALAYAYWALGLCHLQIGEFHEAIVAERRAVEIAETIGDAPIAVSATWVVGIVHAVRGDWDDGIAECQRAVQKARDVLYRAIATGFLGFAHLEKGEAHAAVVALEESIPLLRQFGLKAFEGWFTTFLAEANRLEGRLDQAGALAESALRIATDASFVVAVGWAQLSLGRTAAARHDLPGATAWLDMALTTFTTAHSGYERARTHMDLGRVWWARGDSETARRHFVAADELFRNLGVPKYRARVQELAADCGIRLVSERPV